MDPVLDAWPRLYEALLATWANDRTKDAAIASSFALAPVILDNTICQYESMRGDLLRTVQQREDQLLVVIA